MHSLAIIILTLIKKRKYFWLMNFRLVVSSFVLYHFLAEKGLFKSCASICFIVINFNHRNGSNMLIVLVRTM